MLLWDSERLKSVTKINGLELDSDFKDARE